MSRAYPDLVPTHDTPSWVSIISFSPLSYRQIMVTGWVRRRLDAVGGVVHMLVHYTPAGMTCNCLICRQRTH